MVTIKMTYRIEKVHYEDSVTLERHVTHTELEQYMNRAWRLVRSDEARPVKDLVITKVLETEDRSPRTW